MHLRKNKSQKVSIKNTVYATSNKALKMKKRQLTRLVILVLKHNRDFRYQLSNPAKRNHKFSNRFFKLAKRNRFFNCAKRNHKFRNRFFNH